jgi:acyl carrier protein
MTKTTDLRMFIVDNFLFGEDDQITDQTPLVESGIVDSTGILEIIGFIETTYRVAVKDDEVIPDNFSNLASMDAYLQEKLRTPQLVFNS